MLNRLFHKIQGLITSQKNMSLQIDITNACNLTCLHCYHPHHKNDGAISVEDWVNILTQFKKIIFKLNMEPSFIICGGEPFISKNFLPILNILNEMFNFPSIVVLTNGTVINSSLIEQFKKMNISFQISLDGPTRETHDKIRGAGSFDKAIKTFKVFQDEKIKVTTLITLTFQTSKEIESFFQLGKENKFTSVNFTRFIGQGEGLKMVESNIDRPLAPLELKRAYEDILKNSKKYRVQTNTAKPLYHLVDQFLGGHSKFGIQGIVIDYKGNMKVSSRTNYVIGNVLKEGMENLFFNNPILKKLRKGEVEACGKCNHYKKCGGDRNASFAATGSFLMKDPGCWI